MSVHCVCFNNKNNKGKKDSLQWCEVFPLPFSLQIPHIISLYLKDKINNEKTFFLS